MTAMIPSYSTELFHDIYPTYEEFKTDYLNLGVGCFGQVIQESDAKLTYYLLLARFSNSPIANYDTEQFKLKLQGVIWQYAPAWVKRLDIQKKLRELSDEDLLKGSKAYYNHAQNPGEITAETLVNEPELKYLDSQNTTRYEKTKMDAYTQLWDLLATDVTNDYVNRFKPLFKQFVRPERNYIYESEE